jgi:trehalose synthase
MGDEKMLASYGEVVGEGVISQLNHLAEQLYGRSVVHVNSTREGGGVAEIMNLLHPLMNDLGLKASWEVIEGNPGFFNVTKKFHDGLQGFRIEFGEDDVRVYEETIKENSKSLVDKLSSADFVFIHDPQPAALLDCCTKRKGKWIWRCHVDASRPYRPVWKYLEKIVSGYDASIFSMSQFARSMPHPQYLIAPSIDPLSEKNRSIAREEVNDIVREFQIDTDRPVLTQVSRFDRFKDPIGVIQAYKMVKGKKRPQLILTGGGAADDPEGSAVLEEVERAAGDDLDIQVLDLPADSHRVINASQSASDIIIQKSTKEGFGLTVTEGLWKGKPVIGGDVGGIRLQVHNFHTGFLVNSPEGAALRIRYLFQHPTLRARMGKNAREFVRDNFLLTRHLREFLSLMVCLERGNSSRVIPL